MLAILGAILLPALGASREAARHAQCASHLRHAVLACRMYADQNRGFGPAIGEPYAALPNWALQVLASARSTRVNPAGWYDSNSVLVCPTVRAFYRHEMTRTYAMNATGHAGQPGDPDTYDDPLRPAHIRIDRVRRPAETALLLDSARAPISGPAPPAPRTASMIDFRQVAHREKRVARLHRNRRTFNAAMIDGAVLSAQQVPASWENPLP